MSIRVEQVSPPVVPSISIPAAIVLQTLHNCRICVHLPRCGLYIQISKRSATAKTSHRRTKDARNYTSHTPVTDEPRTQTIRISPRHTPSSYAFRTSIAPASMSSARFNTRHKSTAHERHTLSEPAHTWNKRKADAYAPATHELQTFIARIKTSDKAASEQNRTLSDELRKY